MTEPVGGMARIEVAAADWLVANARWLFWTGLVAALIATAGFTQMKLRNDYRSFFGKNDAILDRTDRLSARMGDAKESAILIYQPQDRNALSSLSLLQYGEVADAAKTLPFVVKAKSWYDAEKIVALPGKGASAPRLALVPFAEGADLFSPAGLHTLSRDIAATPTINGRYVARDRSSATVLLQIDLESAPGNRIAKLARLEGAVGRIERELQRAAPHDRLLLVGSTMFDYASTQVLGADAKRLFPIALLIIVVTVMLLYRSIAFTIASLGLIVLPVMATAGLVAALGIEFSTLAVSALLLVGTLAVADVLHVANSFFLVSEHEPHPPTALRKALGKNFWAITATSSTTAIGEIALLFSAAPPVRVMGITVIIGVVVAWLLAVMMLPWILLQIRVTKRTGAAMLSGPLARISITCARRPWPVLAAFGAVMALSVYGVSLSRIDDSMSGWFSKETRFRQGMDMLNDQYLGLRTMTLATLVRDRDRTIADSPAEARIVRRDWVTLQNKLSAGPEGYWLSVVTASRAFGRRLATGGPSGLRPEPTLLGDPLAPVSSRALSDAGMMTQYEPGKVDYAVAYFDPRGTTTFDTLAAAARLEAIAHAAAPDRDPSVQGVSLAFASLSARNFYGIVSGSVAAFLIMTASLMVVFGSWRLGLLSMIPNIAPLLLVYGLWGFMDGRINMAAVSVFSVACGIVVDDTIHLVLMYKRFRTAGAGLEQAIGEALESSGTGVLATTIVIAAGFFLLGTSDFSLTAQKAMMVGTAIAVAFLFDLFVMPALLAAVERIRLQYARESRSPSLAS